MDWGSFVSYFGEKNAKTLPLGHLEILSYPYQRLEDLKLAFQRIGHCSLCTYQHVYVDKHSRETGIGQLVGFTETS